MPLAALLAEPGKVAARLVLLALLLAVPLAARLLAAPPAVRPLVVPLVGRLELVGLGLLEPAAPAELEPAVLAGHAPQPR